MLIVICIRTATTSSLGAQELRHVLDTFQESYEVTLTSFFLEQSRYSKKRDEGPFAEVRHVVDKSVQYSLEYVFSISISDIVSCAFQLQDHSPIGFAVIL